MLTLLYLRGKGASFHVHSVCLNLPHSKTSFLTTRHLYSFHFLNVNSIRKQAICRDSKRCYVHLTLLHSIPRSDAMKSFATIKHPSLSGRRSSLNTSPGFSSPTPTVFQTEKSSHPTPIAVKIPPLRIRRAFVSQLKSHSPNKHGTRQVNLRGT